MIKQFQHGLAAVALTAAMIVALAPSMRNTAQRWGTQS